MRTIDLESLKIFRTVVDEGGVVRAANKLNRVQSNVTTRIRQLEEHLGTRLFRREGRSIRLSAEGHTLLTYADRLLRLADETVSEMRNGKPKGVFRLGALESTAGSRLAPIDECQGSCRLNYVMIPPIDEATALAAQMPEDANLRLVMSVPRCSLRRRSG